ncbi:hypothetical protein [Burkholderia sp. Ac-20379]|uniref:hypothetical protein n=1 Tax=Burkholderia sp. Ac-20379 TaxID=2703900 RepID=UPI0019820097|nr:hypothetical protein [Burkholderia sp. Ac-20379]
MSAHWVMLGLAAVTGWMGIVGARDLLRAKQRQLVPVRVRRPDDTQARRASRY